MCPKQRRLTRSGVPCVIGQGSILNFLWLILSWTQEQKLGELPVVDQAPAIWAGCCGLRVRVLFSYTVWPCLYFSLSALNAPSLLRMSSPFHTFSLSSGKCQTWTRELSLEGVGEMSCSWERLFQAKRAASGRSTGPRKSRALGRGAVEVGLEALKGFVLAEGCSWVEDRESKHQVIRCLGGTWGQWGATGGL